MKGLLTLEGLAIPMIRRDDVTICDFVRRCVWPLPRQEAGPMEVGLRSRQAWSVGRGQYHPFAIG